MPISHRRSRRRTFGVSRSMVVALVALVAAISGVAVAAPTGNVQPKHKAVAASGQRGPRGFRGPRGLPGPRGKTGPQGNPGPAGGFSVANVTQASGPSALMCVSGGGSCEVGSSVATCPAGSVVLGGGWDGENNPPVVATVGYSKPLGANTWEVIMVNNDSSLSANFHAVATCAMSSGAAADIARAGKLSLDQRTQIARDVAAVRARLN
jgi:hypothetical protein